MVATQVVTTTIGEAAGLGRSAHISYHISHISYEYRTECGVDGNILYLSAIYHNLRGSSRQGGIESTKHSLQCVWPMVLPVASHHQS